MNGGYRHDADDVFGNATAGKIVYGISKTLADRSDRFGAAESLGQFVTDVSGLNVGEDEDVRFARNLAARSFQSGDFGDERGVKLQFAVESEIGRFFVRDLGRVLDFGNGVVLRAALRRERKHRDSRLDARDLYGAVRGRDRDIRELILIGHNVDGAVAVDHNVFFAVSGAFGEAHDKATRNGGDPGSGLDDLERGTKGVARAVDGAGNHSVRIARFNHKDGEIGAILGEASRLFLGHTLRFTDIIEKVGVLFRKIAGFGIDDRDAVELRIRAFRLDHAFVTDEGQTGDLFRRDHFSRANNALLFAFRKNDMLVQKSRFLLDFIHQFRHFQISFIKRFIASLKKCIIIITPREGKKQEYKGNNIAEFMKIAFITAEFNPLHNGHIKLLTEVRDRLRPDSVCVILNGDVTQRGSLALSDKYTRARHALTAGADIVVELPQIFGVSCAERFADGAIKIAAAVKNEEKVVCFGSECGSLPLIENAAKLSAEEPEEISLAIRDLLDMGFSFPVARAQAFREYAERNGITIPELTSPNDVLAIEYVRAAKRRGEFEFFALPRKGDYKALSLSDELPSSGAIRNALIEKKTEEIARAVPPYVLSDLLALPDQNAFSALILYKLANMSAEGLKRIADVTEGIENRILRLAKDATNAEELVRTAATKRYSEARVRRILANALLGVGKTFFESEIDAAPYFKILGVKKDRTDLLSLFSKYGKILTGEEEAKTCGDKSAAICALSHEIYLVSKGLPLSGGGMLLL